MSTPSRRQPKEALESSLSSKVLFFYPYTLKCNTAEDALILGQRDWVVVELG